MSAEELAINNPPSYGEPKYSHLLSLPKELRLEIWKHTITSPSSSHPILHIDQGHSPSPLSHPSPNTRHNTLQPRFHPVVKTTFDTPPGYSINVNILRANTLIYAESLPLLYHSVTFSPINMFAEFLASLSAYATQHICRVRLCLHETISPQVHFSWVVRCAQVARLPGVREVEVQSDLLMQGSLQTRMVRPLLRIAAVKRYVPEVSDWVFQAVLGEVESKMVEERKVRRGKVEVGAVRKDEERVGVDGGFADNGTEKPRPSCPLPMALEQAIAKNLYAKEEPEQGEEESWDVVSVRSLDSSTHDVHSKLIHSVKSSGSSLDSEDSLPVYNDWEVIESAPSDDETQMNHTFIARVICSPWIRHASHRTVKYNH